ncbi:leucyl aminopeptidase [Chromobacterium subtsugae]|uniref:Probable cytosol aminopeptidase n=1 Tax=Chromobacterium subtsugae TaxID=251747 RepID=A0ABS7FE12_9NEIS|nr:leucyl aminopeptidase [Chromobacterium subtsugae]KUM03060.1 aminopeptidase [Chromobacterium subtsugae]MBW8287563.1 leucyl aminopeptidase [Chromobacterium subtsugae]WSE93518.1 leucyl aminopeptidase [Chromobacterium subtsugae]WVH61896.1 leucyl aminopeptidase [Chromobacterium subtsugae]
MEFNIKSGSPEKQRVACVIVGVYESRKLTFAADLLDRISNGFISDVIRHGDMEGKLGSTLVLHSVPHTLCDRVMLVGLGKEREFRAKEYREAVRASIKALTQTSAGEAVSYLSELTVKKHDVEWMIEQAAVVTLDVLYRFDRFKSKSDEPVREPRKLTLAVPRRSDLADGEKGLQRGLAIGSGMRLAKDLGNLPPNVCTPAYLGGEALKMAEAFGAAAEVLGPKEIADLGMHSFLSVAKGSSEEARLIVLKHQGAKDKNDKPIVLVGKGITFDSGGISLKPGEGMDEMKYDMCGAATVLGAFRAAVEMNLPLNLVAIVPACENMPNGNAVKPGDIITSMSGQTIEVLNTDAEGRLILCDALTYAERFGPATVIDVATLTGACVIALGHIATGLYSNQDSLARELLAAGEEVADRAWHMPLWDEYQELLKSPFADMANIGGRPGGSVTAACFLSRFAKAYDWAHLDIAGTAWKGGKEKGATARPVPLLVQFLQDRADIALGNVVRRGRPRRETPEVAEDDQD